MQSGIPGVPQSNFYAAQKPTESTGRAENTTAKTEAKDDEPSVLDEVREKGFLAYVEEIHEKKREELREKILEAMGLGEEQLAEMPAEQRGQIEDMIAEEIRRRMMAQTTMNSGDALPEIGNKTNPAAMSNIQNGMNTGLALLQAVEHLSDISPNSRSKEPDDDNG